MVNLLYFGMTGQFSLPPLQLLLNNDVLPAAVIVPAAERQAPPQRLSESPTGQNIIALALAAGVPVWAVGSLRQPAALALLRRLQPELVAVACFPHIFPAELLSLPKFGCLNLHPSLLPAYRGPEPLFWQAYFDERDTGVTLHLMSQQADAGDIVAQARVERPDGLSGAELERRCAVAGAELLFNAVRQLERGQPLPRTPQVESAASYFPFPGDDELIIPRSWPARRAFNFLRGAAGWPLHIDAGDRRFCIRVAKSYAADHSLDRPYILLGDELWMQFNPGVVQAKIWPDLGPCQ